MKDFDTSAFDWCTKQSNRIESEYQKIQERQEDLEEKQHSMNIVLYCMCFCMGALFTCGIAMIMGVL